MIHIPDSPIMTKPCEWCGELFSYVDNSNPRKFCKKGKCAQRKLAVKEIKDGA